MNVWEFIGLSVSLTAYIVTGLVMVSDAWRAWVWRIPTYSELIWAHLDAWRDGYCGFPWGTVAIIAALVLGMSLIPIGMLIHFVA